MAVCVYCTGCSAMVAAGSPPRVRTETTREEMPRTQMPRVVVVSDGESDDRNSLIRLLLYANELDIAGIIGGPHGRQNPTGDMAWIEERISAYDECRPNLLKHDPSYPSADELRRVVFPGEQAGSDNAGKKRVVEILLDGDPRPVHIQLWGAVGPANAALAELKSRQAADVDRAMGKARFYSVWGQGVDVGPNLMAQAPGKVHMVNAKRVFGYLAYRGWFPVAPEYAKHTSDAWQRANIRNHGPLSELYLQGATLEGDTPALLYSVDNGLRSAEDPTYGGWGGRFALQSPLYWKDVPDDGDVTKSGARWLEAIQNDYAARLDWCTADDYSKANHPPRAVLSHPADLAADGGIEVRLSASPSTDPDNDALRFKWWHYRAAGTYDGSVSISNADRAEASFTFPQDAAGKTVHVILEVTDDGTPALTRYRRVIVTGAAARGTRP